MSDDSSTQQALDALRPKGFVQTQSLHTFESTGERAAVWIVWVESGVLEWSHAPSGQTWSWTHALDGLDLSYEKGLLKDELHLGGRCFALPRGWGKRAQALVESLARAPEADFDRALFPSYYEAPPRALLPVLEDVLGDQALLAAKEVSPGEHLNNAVTSWLFVGVEDAWVFWWTDPSPQGVRSALWRKLPPGKLNVQTSLGRDTFWLQDDHVFSGPLLGTGGLRSLASMLELSPRARLVHVAEIAFSDEQWRQGDDMLQRALARIERREDADEELRHHVYLQRAYGFFMRQEHEAARTSLGHLTRALPEDDLMARSDSLALDRHSWWIVLAVAHEEAADHVCAARVYAALSQDDASSAFRLQQARCALLAQDRLQAIECYDAFVQARAQSHGFDLSPPEQGRGLDAAQATADPDLVAACEELGALYCEQSQRPMAARTYMTLIRQAPLHLPGYERLLELAHDLEGSLRDQAKAAERILWLLDPVKAQALGLERERDVVSGWMTRARPIDPQTHDALIVHEREQDHSAVAQKWLSQLITDRQTTEDIERHCQRVTPSSAPELMDALDRVGRALGVSVPRVYLSHGMSGVQVMGDPAAPFILMGSCHLSARDPQALEVRHQVFALASQMEHIRANHLVLTSSEFWGAFRGKSLDGLVTVLSLIPIGGLLGTFTDKIAGSLFGSIKGMEKGAISAVTGYIEKSLQDGTGGHVQSAYELTLGRIALSQRAQQAPPESLLKEQLADFARAAMYTADRVGLVACDDLLMSVEALLLLSPRAHAMRQQVLQEGVLVLLNQEDPQGGLMYAELALRISELLKFALSDERQQLRAFFHEVEGTQVQSRPEPSHEREPQSYDRRGRAP